MSADLDVTEDATSSRSSVYALGVAFAGDGRAMGAATSSADSPESPRAIPLSARAA